jgi:putative hemin transport protein
MHTTTELERPEADLHRAYLAMRSEERPPRQRDAAARLGVSEAELVAAHCGETATRLRAEWFEILAELGTLGTVMALTRNEHTVIEKDGVYGEVKGHAHVAIMRNGALDLRLFCSTWASGFACVEAGEKTKRSLQFFDESGTAVHKVHLREASDVEAFDVLVAKYRDDNQSPDLAVSPQPVETYLDDASVDVESLRSAWDGMTEVHQFFGILKKHNVSRRQALKLAGDDRAHRVSGKALETVLSRAAETALDIMVFVGNRGCIEIHSGPVERIVSMKGWINVLDSEFNLHANETGLHEAWVVRKPSQGMILSSLEFYSSDGENTALLFVNREGGEEHIVRWNALLASLGPQP